MTRIEIGTVIALVVAIGGAAYTFGRVYQQVEGINSRLHKVEEHDYSGLMAKVGDVKANTADLKIKVGDLEANTGDLKTKVADIETDTGNLKPKVDGLETNTDSLVAKLSGLDTNTTYLITKTSELESDIRNLKARKPTGTTIPNSIVAKQDQYSFTLPKEWTPHRFRLMDNADACFLTKLHGVFAGGGEMVEIVHDERTGHWYLVGHAIQELKVGARCIKFSLK